MNRKLYILLTDTGSLLTKMIKLYTKKPYNHVSLSLDGHLLHVYSFGRKRPRNPLIGGFVKENIQTGVFKQAECAVYSCTITDEQFHKIKEHILEMEKQQHHYRYNFIGLFAVAFNKKLDRRNAFFCSQFVATVLKESGVIDISKPPCLVTPHDLQEVNSFQLIYQGNLEDYFQKTEAANGIA